MTIYTHNNINYNLTESLRNNFKSLLNYFSVLSPKKLCGFLKENENMFIVLEEIKPILEKYFPHKSYLIKIIEDPEFNNDTKLIVYIKLDYSKEDLDEVLNKLNKVNAEIRPVKRKSNNLNNFLVDVECL